ncbi:MAG: DNA adenine methylase [Bacteroidetes bacterium]|nr:DNA adenine methylase [Bacteroidota bacterium]MBS1630085.1 DNA adenine methylase [Bacteroidota bacterium]
MSFKSDFLTEERGNSQSVSLFDRSPGTAKPFLKWAGGKGQLLNQFKKYYPKQLKQGMLKTYYEPFLGSGAVFFDVAQRYNIERAFLFDINEELILTYQVIQNDVSKLLEYLDSYQKNYLKLDKKKRQEFYYEQRSSYNLQRFSIDYEHYSEEWLPRAAQLIFLNRTCFNGLYRVNASGAFNAPAGDYNNPKIYDEQNLLAVHQILQIAEIKIADFKEVTHYITDNSFVYLDPPYRPISKTANFNSYSKSRFADLEQIQLASLFRKLDQSGIQLMLSNSDPKNNNPLDHFFDELYDGFIIHRIPAKRMINSDASKRGAINEIIVTNYPCS